MNRERLQKIRNFQSTDWYPALFVRPICILVMMVIADWKFVTPNLLTTLANVFKLASAALIVVDDGSYTVWAVVFLQLGILFDHLDGTMARYKRAFTKLGSFYDKVSDLVTWFVIVLALGWATYQSSGQAYYLVLAVGSSFALDIMGYMKWLSVAESERLRWFEAKEDPEAAVERKTQPIVVAPPPERTRAQWIRWFTRMSIQFVRFEEMDLFFWIGLGLLLDRREWLVWLLFVSQTAILLSMFWRRTREIIAVDRKMAKLADR